MNTTEIRVTEMNKAAKVEQAYYAEIKQAAKRFTKAEDVEQVYDVAAWDNNTHSEGCYALAVAAAYELGGVEVANSNDDNRSKSSTPAITFEFDDSSSAYVSYGGVFVILPNEPY